MRNQKGFTLVEVLLALTGMCMLALTVSLLITFGRSQSAGLEASILIDAILAENTTEVQTTTFDNVPAYGQCIIRHYSFLGILQSQELKSVSDIAECRTSFDNTYRIVWYVPPLGSYNISFSHPQLKLPYYKSDLKLVYIIGEAQQRDNQMQGNRRFNKFSEGGCDEIGEQRFHYHRVVDSRLFGVSGCSGKFVYYQPHRQRKCAI